MMCIHVTRHNIARYFRVVKKGVSSAAFTMHKNAKTKGNNPGNNIKGQECTAKKHHTGQMGQTYVEDPGARSKTVSKRTPTVIKKMDEMYKTSHTKWWARWETESGATGSYCSPGCSFSDGATTVQEVETSNLSIDAEKASGIEYPAPPEPTDVEVNAEEEEGVRNRRKKMKLSECNICEKSHVGKSKKGKEKKLCNWLKCEVFNCDYWVHALCVGFVYKKDSDVKNVQYYCPTHIKRFI